VSDLQQALRAGRTWFYDPAEYTATLDVVGAGFVPMGSAGLVSADTSTLKIQATSVPSNWSIVVVSGAADEAGTGALDPAISTRTYAASDLVNDSIKVKVSSRVSKFYRVMLRDPGGNIYAYSNPLWLLRSMPQVAVPEQRWAERRVSPSPSVSVSATSYQSPSTSMSDTTTTDPEPTGTDTVTATETVTETSTETATEDPPPP